MQEGKWIATCLLCLAGCASHPKPHPLASAPATAPATQPNYSITDMRVQTFRPTPFFYASTQTTMAEIGPAADRIMASLHAATREGHAMGAGPPIFIYHGMTEELNKPFELQVGLPVPPDTKPYGEFKVRTLDAFHCATVIYSGPVESLGKAYDKLIGQMLEAHLSPGNESREIYFFWEGPESPNDALQVQIGIR